MKETFICLFHSLDTDAPGEVLLHVKQEAEASPICSQFTVKKEQPSAQLYNLLPSSSETCIGHEATSLSKTQDKLKPPKVNVAPDGNGTDKKLFFISQVAVLELIVSSQICLFYSCSAL